MALTKVPSNLDSITATTQSQGDGSTNVATTAYVDTGLANLIDSAPGNLNTLNELAAAMNDNASFFSTVLPLSGGTLTGNLAHASDFTLDVGGNITLDADGGEILLKDGGTEVGRFLLNDNNHLKLKSIQSDADILLQGNDGGSGITALRLDMSAAGKATFNASVTAPQFLVSGNTSVQGIQIGQDASNSTNSGRLFFTESGGSWAIFNSNDSLSFNNGGTYGSSSGTQRAYLTAAGNLNIDGTFTAGSHINGGDGVELRLGDSQDILLKHHSGGYGHLENKTGTFYIDSETFDIRTDIDNAGLAIGIDANQRVGINQTPSGTNFSLQVTGQVTDGTDARAAYFKGYGTQTSIGSTGPTLVVQNANLTQNNYAKLSFESGNAGETVSINARNIDHSNHYGDMAFNTRGSGGYSEKMRITSNGNVAIGNGGETQGDNYLLSAYGSVVTCWFENRTTTAGHEVMILNRKDSHGTMMAFLYNDSEKGSITQSGGAVSYNAFMGSHYTETSEDQPNILIGTVMETVDELVENKYEDQKRLAKCKVSDTSESSNVYGVWFADDGMGQVAALGASFCRINSEVTVSMGDLLVSNGDGTAKIQSDDIIRSKTIGKVTSTVKKETYSDGSYVVPVVLYCG